MDGKYSAVFCRGVGFEPLRRALALSREPMDPGYKDMKELEQDNIGIIEELQSKIQALENENRLLKERLDEAGVSYADIAADENAELTERYDPDQGARIREFEVTDKNANAFFLMFCRGRKDVYDLRHTNPKTGKNGYYTQCYNRWDPSCHSMR